tara:strand:+ start:4028 stop:4243 length:216 start_codon:yes stop_codon:yes gene_type:complete
MSQVMSPVTGIIEEELVTIHFGEHRGKTVKDIQEIDPEFYQKLIELSESGRSALRRGMNRTFDLFQKPVSL